MASRKNSNESLINHFGLVRLRVTGTGNLQMSLLSRSGSRNFNLAQLPMSANTDIEPTRLSNFTEQAAQLKVNVINLGETFLISKIIVFVRPVAKSYPSQVG